MAEFTSRLSSRGDIRVTERNLAEATANVGVVTADLFPRVTLAGSVALQAGSWDQRRVSADFGQPLSANVSARVTGMYENSDSYRGEAGLERQVKTKEEEIDPREACTLKLDSVSSDIRIGRFGPYFEKRRGAW